MRHVVFIQVGDRKGLIYDITGVFLAHQVNIVSNGEYTNKQERLFYMRSELEGSCDPVQLEADLVAVLTADAIVKVRETRAKDIVILASKESHCLGDLLLRSFSGELNANIKAVVSNHPNLGNLVEKFGVPFEYVSFKDMSRPDHETAILGKVSAYEPEYLVLAKYMMVLSPGFVKTYPNRIINIHHSFLPAFIGARPYHQAYERGVKIIGATAHFVTNDLDEGPIISQKVLPVDHSHSAQDMARVGRDSERLALSNALALVFEDRVFVHGNRTIIFG